MPDHRFGASIKFEGHPAGLFLDEACTRNTRRLQLHASALPRALSYGCRGPIRAASAVHLDRARPIRPVRRIRNPQVWHPVPREHPTGLPRRGIVTELWFDPSPQCRRCSGRPTSGHDVGRMDQYRPSTGPCCMDGPAHHTSACCRPARQCRRNRFDPGEHLCVAGTVCDLSQVQLTLTDPAWQQARIRVHPGAASRPAQAVTGEQHTRLGRAWPDLLALPAVIGAMVLMLVTLPVSLPIALLLGRNDRRRLGAVAMVTPCSRCGTLLGPDAAAASDAAHMTALAEAQRRYPHPPRPRRTPRPGALPRLRRGLRVGRETPDAAPAGGPGDCPGWTGRATG